MAKKSCKLRLLNKENKVVCLIDAITYYSTENNSDEGEIFYIHPITGSRCQSITQTLQGWSEQDKEDNQNWDKLIKEIEKDRDISAKMWDMDTVDYYA